MTVIVAEPAALAVTTPLDETVATDVLLEDQVTPLLVAFEGETVAFSVPVFPTVRLIEDLSRDTPVTATVALVTVTLQVAVLPPSAVLTVMVVLPAASAVTTPSDDAFATAGLLEE